MIKIFEGSREFGNLARAVGTIQPEADNQQAGFAGIHPAVGRRQAVAGRHLAVAGMRLAVAGRRLAVAGRRLAVAGRQQVAQDIVVAASDRSLAVAAGCTPADRAGSARHSERQRGSLGKMSPSCKRGR